MNLPNPSEATNATGHSSELVAREARGDMA